MQISITFLAAKAAIVRGEMTCVSEALLAQLKKKKTFEYTTTPAMQWRWVLNESATSDDPRYQDDSRHSGDDRYIVGAIGTPFFEQLLIDRGEISKKVSNLAHEAADLLLEPLNDTYSRILSRKIALNSKEAESYLLSLMRTYKYQHRITLLPTDLKELDLTNREHLLRAIQIEQANFRFKSQLKHIEIYETPYGEESYENSLKEAEKQYQTDLRDPKNVCNANVVDAILEYNSEVLKELFINGIFPSWEKIFGLATGVKLLRLSKAKKALALDEWAEWSRKREDGLKQWTSLDDIPVNSDDEIEEPFLHFEPGTHRECIWQWFEKEYDVSVSLWRRHLVCERSTKY